MVIKRRKHCSPEDKISGYLHLLYLIYPSLRLTTLSLAVAQKNIDQPPYLSIADFTLVLSRRPLGDLWKVSEMASHQKNSSRKVSW